MARDAAALRLRTCDTGDRARASYDKGWRSEVRGLRAGAVRERRPAMRGEARRGEGGRERCARAQYERRWEERALGGADRCSVGTGDTRSQTDHCKHWRTKASPLRNRTHTSPGEHAYIRDYTRHG